MEHLPALNAFLNFVSASFLTAGYIYIRKKNQTAHRNCMIGALAASTLFLASYIYYHFNAGRTVFLEPKWFRPIYLGILLTHTVLAVVIVPLVLVTVTRAFRKRFEAHRAIARWTWPIWMYVSLTGVLIYFLLYQIYPQKKVLPATPEPHPAAQLRQ